MTTSNDRDDVDGKLAELYAAELDREKEPIPWCGIVTSVQPRIGLLRSWDERSHSYHGYLLRVRDPDYQGELAIGVGKAAHKKHEFTVGDEVQGQSRYIFGDPRKHVERLHKTSKLKILNKGRHPSTKKVPPWHTLAPALPIYRERGHRRLAARTYETKCISCVWGCKMAVEIIVDKWKPHMAPKRRFETFCYGPTSCRFYKAGPPRTIPGRRSESWTEEDWVDEDAVAHRDPDE